MAIDMGSETVTVAKHEQTWRIEFFCEHGEDPTIRYHREILAMNGEEIASRDRNIDVVERKLSEIVAVTYGGLTGQQLADALMAWGDGLRQEDIDAGAEEEGGTQQMMKGSKT